MIAQCHELWVQPIIDDPQECHQLMSITTNREMTPLAKPIKR